MARYAQFEFLMSGMRDSSGNALGSGTVTFYSPGTTSFKNVYSTHDGSGGAADNPATLDARGAALLFGFGAYTVLIKDVDGVEQYTWENLLVGISASANRGTDTATSAGQTTFTIPFTPTGGSGLFVIHNGVVIEDSNYTISGLSCILTAAQAAFVQVGDEIEFIEG